MLDGRQRGRRVVELGAGGDDVHTFVLAVEDDGGAELVVGAHTPAERVGQGLRERDRVPFDGDVDVEAALPEQDVAHRPPDEVDALVGLGDGRDGLEDRLQALEPGELAGEHRTGPLRGGGPPPSARSRSPRVTTPTIRSSSSTAIRRPRRRPAAAARRAACRRAHVATRVLMIPLAGACESPCATALVEVLPAPRRRRAGRPRRRGCRSGRGAGRRTIARATVSSGATVRAGPTSARARRERLATARRAPRRAVARAPRKRPRKIAEAACGCPPPPSSSATASGVELGGPAAGDAEDPALHLDEHDEGRAVGDVDELVGEVRDAVDVARPGDGGDEHLDPASSRGSSRLEQRREQLALVAR